MEQWINQNVNGTVQYATPVYAVLGKKAEAEFRQNGKTDGGFAVLNGNTVTFGGKCFVKKGRHFDEQRVNWSASVNEIQGCTYTRPTNILMLLLAIAFTVLGLVLFIVISINDRVDGFIENDASWNMLRVMALALIPVGGIFVFRFIKSRRAFFEISMQGASICYDMRTLEAGEEVAFREAVQKVRMANPNYAYPQMNRPW